MAVPGHLLHKSLRSAITRMTERRDELTSRSQSLSGTNPAESQRLAAEARGLTFALEVIHGRTGFEVEP